MTDSCSTIIAAIIELARLPPGTGPTVDFEGCRLESLVLHDNGQLTAVRGSGGAIVDNWQLLEDLTRGVTGWEVHRQPSVDDPDLTVADFATLSTSAQGAYLHAGAGRDHPQWDALFGVWSARILRARHLRDRGSDRRASQHT